MIAARHDSAASGLFHCRGDSLRIGCNDGIANSGGFGETQDVHDHRGAVQVRQRFAG